MAQKTWVVRVLTIAGRTENIEVRADTQSQAMTKAKGLDFVKRVDGAWEGRIR